MTEPEEAAESADAAQSAVDTESSPPPWGDDFNAERAWQTISHLRGREKELESDAKAFKRLQEDEDARREFVSQFYEFEDGEEDGEAPDLQDDNDDPYESRIAAIERAEQERAQREEAQTFQNMWSGWEDYIKGQVPEGARELTRWELKALQSESVGKKGLPVEPEKAKKVLDTFLKEREEYHTGIVESYRQSKRAPTRPPQPGRAGDAEFDRKSATPAQRRANREARLAAAIEAANQ